MKYAAVTKYFILSAILIIACYDAFVISAGGVEVSISHTMIEWGYKYPIFTFAFGVVVGHLFWRMRDTAGTKKITDFVDGK